MTSVETRVLLIDYSQGNHELLQKTFGKEGYTFTGVHSSKSSLKKVQEWAPHLIFVGRAGTTAESMALISQIRALSDALIVKIADNDSWETEVHAFEAGADDYLRRPLRMRALLKRVKALLRRLQTRETLTEITVDDLFLNKKYHRLEVNGVPADIPKAGFNLLFFLVTHPEQVFSRKELIRKVWGETAVIEERSIDVHINTIRGLIGKSRIKTVKKSGYKFKLADKK